MKSIICGIWVLAGAAIALWSIYSEVVLQSKFGFIAGSFTAALIAVAFGLLAIAGGVLSIRARALGVPLLRTVSSLAILYAAMFLLLGREDRSIWYLVGVVGLLLLAVASLFVVRHRVPDGA